MSMKRALLDENKEQLGLLHIAWLALSHSDEDSEFMSYYPEAASNAACKDLTEMQEARAKIGEYLAARGVIGA